MSEKIKVSESQTARFEQMLKVNPGMPGLRFALFRERQLDGFEQILSTPPMPGEPDKKYRDYDGVNGEEIIWNQELGRWTFTGRRLQDTPPAPGEPNVKVSQNGRTYTWSVEKNRWWDFGGND